MKTCPHCGNNDENPENTEAKSIIPEHKYSMIWYKILKVILIVGILLDLSQAVAIFGGNVYETWTDAIYAAAPGIKTVNIFKAIICLGTAALKVVIIADLSGYKARGPRLLNLMYVVNALIPLVEMFTLNYVIGNVEQKVIMSGLYRLDLQSLLNPMTTMLSVAIIIGFGIYNYRYFKEREDLFVK